MSGFSVPSFQWVYQGLPASGGSVYVYKTGTTTLQTIYADGALTTPISNPQILDANGQAVFYVDGTTNLRFDGYTVGGIATGTLIKSIDPVYPVAASSSSGSGIPWAVAAGSADVIVATYNPVITVLTDGLLLSFRAFAANATTTPTFAPNGLTAHVITEAGGSALSAGNIAAILAEYIIRYNLANTRWELLNPSPVASSAIAANSVVANATTGSAAPTGIALSTQQTIGRLGGNIIAIPIGVGANSLVEFDGSSKYPAADGSQITNLPSGLQANVQTHATSGTVFTLTVDFTTNFSYTFPLTASNFGAGALTIAASTNAGSTYTNFTGNTITNTGSADVLTISIYQPTTSVDLALYFSSASVTPANGQQRTSGITSAVNRIRLTFGSAIGDVYFNQSATVKR